ncbi:response regulator [Aeoliella sp. ICT_H6.2]|uniref:Response regulator n=1 Tax=Aeoliella straminimaris TaxID=2954799 RepID=A0A9X2JID9_9BACT|nr:response regulator [Aeoliella straminimaris]MCO6043799.1 response regulator [Aeoliella straminimaris]
MSIKALIADDSGVMRKIIVRAATAAGISEITEAVDGADAIAKFGQEHFDLVLTDWNMPNKSGLEVIQEIRDTGSTVPIIMVTTEGEKASVLQAIQAGVSDYLTKPFEADALLAKIEKLSLA